MFCAFIPSLLAAPVAPSNIHVTSNTPDSITFEWDQVSGALGYYLYWGVSSVNENEEITPIEGTQFTLDTLESNMDYKIALTTVDSS